jgi:hypothetical protein
MTPPSPPIAVVVSPFPSNPKDADKIAAHLNPPIPKIGIQKKIDRITPLSIKW